MSKFIKNQIGFLLTGLAFWFPVIVLFLVVSFLFNYLDQTGKTILLLYLPEKWVFSGVGVIFGIFIFYFSGMVLKLNPVRRFFSRIPLLGLLFGNGKAISIDRLLNMNPCLFMMSPTCLSYGWILSEEKVTKIDKPASFTLLNVYYPNVPTLVTGQVFPVRKETVIKLGNPSKEVIDLLLYTFRSPSEIIYFPWEDESREDFEKRAETFGIRLPSD